LNVLLVEFVVVSVDEDVVAPTTLPLLPLLPPVDDENARTTIADDDRRRRRRPLLSLVGETPEA
jgi:hypothetical protein